MPCLDILTADQIDIRLDNHNTTKPAAILTHAFSLVVLQPSAKVSLFTAGTVHHITLWSRLCPFPHHCPGQHTNKVLDGCLLAMSRHCFCHHCFDTDTVGGGDAVCLYMEVVSCIYSNNRSIHHSHQPCWIHPHQTFHQTIYCINLW